MSTAHKWHDTKCLQPEEQTRATQIGKTVATVETIITTHLDPLLNMTNYVELTLKLQSDIEPDPRLLTAKAPDFVYNLGDTYLTTPVAKEDSPAPPHSLTIQPETLTPAQAIAARYRAQRQRELTGSPGELDPLSRSSELTEAHEPEDGVVSPTSDTDHDGPKREVGSPDDSRIIPFGMG